MGPIVYSPAHRRDIGALMQKLKRPKNSLRRFRAARIAHELKNSMSMLILSVGSLAGRASDPPVLFQSRRKAFEKAVFEMNSLVDELIQLIQEETHEEQINE